MSPEQQYRAASVEAERRKTALRTSAATAKARIAPARLVRDVKEKALDTLSNGKAYVVAKAEERPIAVGAAAGAFALYIFRRPLSALFKRIYVRITNRSPETSEIDDG
ncbi:MAG TPA: hypothetical protein VJM09_11590 [Sphingobium sp.]|nr:hypothetical protein [Sphingobium sp.]